MSKSDINSSLREKYIKENFTTTHHIPLFELPGLHALKEQFFIFESVFTQNYSIFNQSSHKAVLLYGIPGVGKTTVALSIASQLKKPVIICDDLLNSFRKAETLKPSVLLIENVDSYEEKQIKLLCNLLDNLKKDVLVIGTSNSELNDNLKRNDRFEVQILLKTPSLKEREEIISYLLFKDEIKNEIINENNKKVDLVDILKMRNYKKKVQTGVQNNEIPRENINSSFESVNLNFNNVKIDVNKIAESTPGFLPSDLIKLIRLSCTFAFKNKEKKLSTERIIETIQFIKKIDVNITFESIGALNEVKDILNLYVIFPTLYPELFKRMGLSKPNGVLLYGPPGCGKTMLARAVSNMSHCNFICVSGPELISKYVGESERDLRELFEKAKSLSPCIIFFDEIDSLCMKRRNSGFNNRIVNQILTLMDGINARGEVYLLAATNRIDVLDEALLRPGRFDKIVKVTLPNKEECLEIFKKVTSSIPLESFNFSELDLEGLSGAEIVGVVKEAGLLAMKRDFSENTIILKEDLIEALKRIKK